MKRNFLLMALFVIIGCSNAQTFKFAVICDTRSDANNSGTNGVNVAAVKAVSSQILNHKAEIILAPGDFICGNVSWYNPQPPSNDDQYMAFLDATSSIGIGLPGSNSPIIIYPVRGNHECYNDLLIADSVKASWIRNIGNFLPQNGPQGEVGLTYSFIRNEILFIGLDQYANVNMKARVDSTIAVNQVWLDSILLTYPEIKHVFTFGHTPAFSAHHTDCLGSNPKKRDAFLRSIEKRSGVYFCGHDHFYARANVPVITKDNNIENYLQQVITPSGAPYLTGNRDDNHKWDGIYRNKEVIKETYIDNALGFQLVSIEGNKVTIEFIATQDAATYYKDPSGVYHYKYNCDWRNWNFATLDSFTYYLPDKTK